MRANRQNNKQSGMAMVLVITILAALLGIAAVGLSLQLDSTKSSGLIRDSRVSLYCAEAGLAAARDTLITNAADWNKVLNGTGAPWYDYTTRPDGSGVYGITGDADGDGNPLNKDFSVTFTDDGETDNNTTVDTNQTIIVTSTCLLYPDAPAQVIEVLSLLANTSCAYRSQAGQGCGNLNNAN